MIRLVAIFLFFQAVADFTEVCGYSVKGSPVNRRQWLDSCSIPAAAAFASIRLSSPALADASNTKQWSLFDDPTHGFSLQVPSGWIKSEQTLRDRRTITLWTDPNDDTKSTLVFIAYTPVRDDYTSLGSFGSVDQVAAQTILPKGEIFAEGREESNVANAEMLSAVSQKQAYVFDYTQSVPGIQPTTHYRTIFTLQQGATGGAGAVLVTITAQTAEERYGKMKPIFDGIIDSYGKSKA
jgi:PsbP